MAFVLVLSFSRQIFLRFFLDARTENFLRGHLDAFAAWNGIPRVILYDNLRSAVLERHGEAIRFNPALLDFAAHYRYEPRPVAVARDNEKGRVERAIRFVRKPSSPPGPSRISMISTPRLTPGAAARPPIDAARKTRPAASPKFSPRKPHDC
jgi:transposase